MAIGCKCGAHVKAGVHDSEELTRDTLFDFLGSLTNARKYWWLVVTWVGSLIYPRVICANPKVAMPSFEFTDLLNFTAIQVKIGQAINNKAYDALCECNDCPPVVGCTGDHVQVVNPEDGYPAGPGSPDRRFHILTGSDLYVEGPDGACLGLKNGVWVYWYADGPGGGFGHLNIRDGNDNAPGNTFWVPDDGSAVTIYFAGAQKPDPTPWPEAPGNPPLYDFPSPCTNSDICATLYEMATQLKEVRFLVDVIAGPQFGITAPIAMQLPGLNSPIAGGLFDTLPRALTALAPVQPSQLVNPTTALVSESSAVELGGSAAYALIELTTVPDRFGYTEGETGRWYYSKGKSPAPGRFVVVGATGVLRADQLVFGQGSELVIPSTATAILLHLEDGVEASITLWERHV